MSEATKMRCKVEDYDGSQTFRVRGEACGLLDAVVRLDWGLDYQERADAVIAHIVRCVNEHDGLAERESAFLRLMDADHCNWTRWRDLLTIRDGRGFDPDELIEYDAFSKIVEMKDEREGTLSHAAEKTG